MNHTEILCVLNSKISDDIGIRKINNILDSCVKYRNDDNYEFECKYLSTNAIFCSSNFCNSYYKKNNLIILFSGQIYNIKQINEILNTDISNPLEIIIQLVASYGMEYTLHILEGCFSFILLDNDALNTKIFIARDRMGLNPFYKIYSRRTGDMIAFSSSILPIKQIKRDILNDQKSYIFESVTQGSYECYYLPLGVLPKWKYVASYNYHNNPVSSFLPTTEYLILENIKNTVN